MPYKNKELYEIYKRKTNENVKKWRKYNKYKMISAMGNRCQICGYDKCHEAMEFHHIDPSIKEYSFGKIRANPKSKELIKKELIKCILLCSNSHREYHSGIIQLPINYNKFSEEIFDSLEKSNLRLCKNKSSNIDRRKIKLSNDEIYNIWIDNNKNFTKTGKIFNVSDNAIRKRISKFIARYHN